MSPNPKISIITVVLNSEKFLEETIKSVLDQNYNNLEYIIIDGGSTDKSLDIIEKYKGKISVFLSEKDNGIYDAFNKGLARATGDIIGILNSDDIYTKDAFKIILKYFNQYPEKDFYFGAVKKHYATLYGYKPWKIKFSWGFYSSHSSGFFIKKKAADIVGLYNTKYKCSADYDYFYRMIVKNKLSGIGTKENEVTGIFRRGGHSSRFTFLERAFEELQIRKDNGQSKLWLIAIVILKLIYNYKRI